MAKTKFQITALIGIIVTSLFLFWSFWFSVKPLKMTSITDYFNHPLLYLCVLISFVGGFLISVVPFRHNRKE